MRFVHVCASTNGKMSVGNKQSSGSYSYWADNGDGLGTFSAVGDVARHIGGLCLNVCLNERVFSISGYVDDSRKSVLLDENYKNRVLIAANGSHDSLAAKVRAAKCDYPGE